MIRITGGQWRGRKLFVPDGDTTRPTMDKTRGAIFNILTNAEWARAPDGRSLLIGGRVFGRLCRYRQYGLRIPIAWRDARDIF